MCGIFGYVGKGISTEILIDGIRRLEYRGYDSWGVSVNTGTPEQNTIITYKSPGRIPTSIPEGLENLKITSGITHTRWATHGAPTEENAHPHSDCNGKLSIVHNGIIENYKTLIHKLKDLGHIFKSQTDSEVIVHLVEQFMYEGLDLRSAFLEMLKSLVGTYGIALLSSDHPDTILVARKSSPLVIGQGDGFNLVASDPSAIISHTRYVVYLDDNECAQLYGDHIETFKLDDSVVEKEVEKLTFDLKAVELGGYSHYMEKEIHEQPQTLQDTMRGRISLGEGSIKLGGIDEILLLKTKRIIILACGTSWHAGLIGKYMFETLAKIPTEVCYAAEFRYANPVINPDTLVIAISQSGETADTLAGIKEAKRLGAPTMGIVNVVGSTIARECGQGIFLHAGPEIGVASTKAFTSQVVILFLLAIQASRMRNMSLREGLLHIDSLKKLPIQAEEILEMDGVLKSLAEEYAHYSNFLYIGRLFEYPLALEGALKLKEISYIHAEGIPAAELKHGPIALIDKNMPVVVLAAQSRVLEKMVSNVNEIRARGGRIISIVSEGASSDGIESVSERVIRIPATIDPLVPVLGAIPLQLLAYHFAIARGCDVDRPRNLAKSVTVE